jgi:hypothetical protein
VPDFEIEAYTVAVTQRGVNPAERRVTLTSVALDHGIRNRASLYFTEQPVSSRLGWVSNVDQPNFNGLAFFAYLRKSDYADIYDVLRNERPVRFYYYYDPPGFNPAAPMIDLTVLWIHTGPEPLGEGPVDVSQLASLSRIDAGAEPPGEGPQDVSP